jgi:formate/nitrite transporter
MSFKDPQEITEAGIKTGATKAKLSWDKALVASFLAGAYIAFGGLLSITVTSGMPEETWGSLPTLFAGAVFALGLILVVIAGSELLTGNFALVPLAAFEGRVKIRQLFQNFGIVTVGNLLGSLFVAYFLAVESGVVTQELQLARLEEIANLKGIEETEWQIFLRAVGCNWLVCLAVWMALAATDVAGKILAIFFPIMAFVAMGFDHVVANMFFLPAAIFADAGNVTWGDALHNWLFAGLGNLLGAAIFVAGAYWYLYARDDDEAEGAGGVQEGVDGKARDPEFAGASSQPVG